MPEAIKTLQRALEREVHDSSANTVTPPASLSRRNSKAPALKRTMSDRRPDVHRRFSKRTSTTAKPVAREGTIDSHTSSSSEGRTRDTLDREFIESGIDALRRVSLSGRGGKVVEKSLPSWTITRYEVDREEKIGIGFFSDVFRGTWRSPHTLTARTVAIKVLAPTTPRKLFVREISIWKTLDHPNVLELYGASSASGDPPWFFVSPYYKNGSLVYYLKKTFSEGSGPGSARFGNKASVDLLKMMHEVSKGMQYLHSRGVLRKIFLAWSILTA